MSINWTTKLKDIKETSVNGKMYTHDTGPDRRWLWSLNHNWSIFSPILIKWYVIFLLAEDRVYDKVAIQFNLKSKNLLNPDKTGRN